MAIVGEARDTVVGERPVTVGADELVARRFVERAVGARDAGVVADVLDPHAIHHSPQLTTLLPLLMAFPDLEVQVSDVSSDGDVVAVESVVTGTQTGTFLGIDPTGAWVEARRIDRFRIASGRIVEGWTHVDQRALAARLGTPAIAAARPRPRGPACIGVARRAIVQRFIEEVLNRRRFVEGPGYFLAQPTDHLGDALATCLLLAGTPDFELSVQDMREEQSTVIVLARVSGARDDGVVTLPGARRPVIGIVELRFRVTRDGRFAETWTRPTAPWPVPARHDARSAALV